MSKKNQSRGYYAPLFQYFLVLRSICMRIVAVMDVALVSLFITMSRFHISLWCLRSQL